MSEIFVFSKAQLKVLLKGSGYDSVMGLNLGNEPLDDITVLNVLNTLLRNGSISLEDNNYKASLQTEKIISTIGKSESCCFIHSNNTELPDMCCFFGDELLICTTRNGDANHFSFFFESLSGLYELISEDSYLPQGKSDIQMDEAELELFESSLTDIKASEKIDQSSAVCFSLEMPGDKSEKYMRIINYYFYSYILYSDGEDKKRVEYSPETAKKILVYIMEKKNDNCGNLCTLN